MVLHLERPESTVSETHFRIALVSFPTAGLFRGGLFRDGQN